MKSEVTEVESPPTSSYLGTGTLWQGELVIVRGTTRFQHSSTAGECLLYPGIIPCFVQGTG